MSGAGAQAAAKDAEQQPQKVSFISRKVQVLIDFLLTVMAATLIFISGRGKAISSAKEGKSGFIDLLSFFGRERLCIS